MLIDLTPEEVHYLKYCLIQTIPTLPEGEERSICLKILEKLPMSVKEDN